MHSSEFSGRRCGSVLTTIVVFLGVAATSRAQIISQEAKLQVPDIHLSGDSLGTGLELSGSTLVAGAPGDDDSGVSNAGSVWVFEHVGSSWPQAAQLVASDVQADARFGSDVSIDGDTIVVGANGDSNSNGQNAGAAYVFVRTPAGWAQQAKLLASNGSTSDLFGTSVVVRGDTIAVGAPLNDTAPFGSSGAIYVFDRVGSVWTQSATLTSQASRLAECLAMDDDTLVAGAQFDVADQQHSAGSATVFVRVHGAWTVQSRLTASDAGALHEFGSSVSIDGDVIAVGAHNHSNNRGAAYVFERSGTTWTQTSKLLALDGSFGSQFGASIGVLDDLLVVGARGANSVSLSSSGAAYFFQRMGTRWSPLATVTASDATSNASFGRRAWLSDGSCIIGSGGEIYAFQLEDAFTSCFGDGSAGAPCPCAPPDFVPVPGSAPERGCANSFDLAGARLAAAGTLAPDQLKLRAHIASDYGGFAFSVKSDATTSIALATDDGLRCVDGTLIRFGGHNAGANGDVFGQWTYPNFAQTTAISAATGQTMGQPAFYQVVYRNAAAGFCSPGTTNWTNVVRIDW